MMKIPWVDDGLPDLDGVLEGATSGYSKSYLSWLPGDDIRWSILRVLISKVGAMALCLEY